MGLNQFARRVSDDPHRSKTRRAGRMNDIAELESRITAALERIDFGLTRLPKTAAPAAPVPEGEELATLRDALEEERIANAQLTERIRALKDREAHSTAGLEARVEQLTRQLDVQGLEVQRLRKTTVQLRETLRVLRDAQMGQVDAHLINKSMMAELEALRADRSAESAELSEILAELAPLIEEAETHA